jgi:hypothetical protein
MDSSQKGAKCEEDKGKELEAYLKLEVHGFHPRVLRELLLAILQRRRPPQPILREDKTGLKGASKQTPEDG